MYLIDKVQKIREEVERLKSRICNNHFLCDYEKGCNDGREDICDDLISFIDSLQEESDYCCGECVKWVDGKGCSREKQNTHCITDAACEEGVRKGSKQKKPKFKTGDTIKCKYDDRQFTIKTVDLDKGTYIYTQECCGNDIDYADEKFELVEKPVSEDLEESAKAVTKNKESAVKFLKNAGIMDENGNLAELYRSEEPVSDDLEKEIKNYFEDWYDGGAAEYGGQATKPNCYFATVEDCKNIAHHFANWQKQQDKETIELAEDHAMLAGRMQMKEELMKDATYLTCCGSHAFSACWCMENVDTSCYKAGDRLKIIVVKED